MADDHHSVMHYHTPFALSHRNAKVFPSPAQSPPADVSAAASLHKQQYRSLADMPAAGGAAAAASSTHMNRAASSPGGRRRAHHAHHLNYEQNSASPLRVAATSSLIAPYQIEHCQLNHYTQEQMEIQQQLHQQHAYEFSDHMMGPRMVPTAAAAAGAIRTPQQESNPIAHSSRGMSYAETQNSWQELKGLRFGIHKCRRQPYVSRDEWVDPLRCTTAARQIPCGYTRREVHYGTRGKLHVEVSVGMRRAPPHTQELPTKINWHDWSKTPARGCVGAEKTTHEETFPRRLTTAAAAAPKLPSTPLVEEAEARLRLNGCGSLVDIRHSSDEAISELLRCCQFSASDRMNLLWLLRREYREHR